MRPFVGILVSLPIRSFEFLFFIVGNNVQPFFSRRILWFVDVAVLNDPVQKENHFSDGKFEPVLINLEGFRQFWRTLNILKVLVDLFLSDDSVSHNLGSLSNRSGIVVHFVGLLQRLELELNSGKVFFNLQHTFYCCKNINFISLMRIEIYFFAFLSL